MTTPLPRPTYPDGPANPPDSPWCPQVTPIGREGHVLRVVDGAPLPIGLALGLFAADLAHGEQVSDEAAEWLAGGAQ